MPKRDEADTFRCGTCDAAKPTLFSPSAVAGKHHICRECANLKGRAARQRRRGSLSRRLLSKLRRLMHKSGRSRSETHGLALSEMDRVVRRFGSRSVFSGVGCVDRLTVAVWNRDVPVGLGNVVVCTHAEAAQHNRRSRGEYHPRFAEHVETRLLADADSHAPFPPMSEFARGITCDAMAWFLRNFGTPHPLVSSPSRNSRYTRLDRMPERLKPDEMKS
jgi:hypothetical protein